MSEIKEQTIKNICYCKLSTVHVTETAERKQRECGQSIT